MPIQVSIIITLLNEEKTIQSLLESLANQTYPIHQVVISDGGSIDQTENKILDFKQSHKTFPLAYISAPGNRSVGRNKAIAMATSEVIAITDAGCVPHRNWVAELINQYEPGAVVAGYYDAKPKTAFETAVVPYVLVMPDKVNPPNFLPATRSMLLEKKVWEKVGGFDPKLSWNEDYAFAQKLVKHQVKIAFAEKAKVSWLPRENLSQFWQMIYHFALGDTQAGILRQKVILIFVRYILALLVLFFLLFKHHLSTALAFLAAGLLLYSCWAVIKNQKYVPQGKLWLPVLQITSDLAVISGSLAGIMSLL